MYYNDNKDNIAKKKPKKKQTQAVECITLKYNIHNINKTLMAALTWFR